MSRLRIAYLQMAPSAHTDACLRALAGTGKADLFVTMPPTLRDAPYDRDRFTWLERPYFLSSLHADDKSLCSELDLFRPDLLLVVGWSVGIYRKCADLLRGKAFRVVCMDNQWLRTPKQILGVATSRIYLKPYFDGAFLPGRRQHSFASKLGFSESNIFEGFYSADTESFSHIAPLGGSNTTDRSAFIFVGRLAAEKGVTDLLGAYEAYRATVSSPWKLIVLGTGPLASLLSGVSGIEYEGFVDPAQLPSQLSRGSFVVLPSVFEPWGVAVHEATAAGLGCICTTAVGAADALVRNEVNGRLIPSRSPGELSSALRWAHDRSATELAAISEASRQLAGQFTPERWAATVLDMGRARRG